jgi:hypothetical protein
VADRNVTVFTFNRNERDAVNELLDSYTAGSPAGQTVWHPIGGGSYGVVATLANGATAEIRHKPLLAQGNVISGAELARTAYEDAKVRDPADDIYIYYACCGALDATLIRNAYRVSRVQYLSLGSVKPRCKFGETTKLKNKWFVRTEPTYQQPLSSIELPTGTTPGPAWLRGFTIPRAFVLATDKVIEVLPSKKAPRSKGSDAQGPKYDDEEWSYSKALAQCRDHCQNPGFGPILIEMETFGVASVADAMGLLDRVLVIRVVTDGLLNKSKDQGGKQREILFKKKDVLHRALATIIGF